MAFFSAYIKAAEKAKNAPPAGIEQGCAAARLISALRLGFMFAFNRASFLTLGALSHSLTLIPRRCSAQWRRAAILLSAALMLPLYPQAASAFELFGVHLWGEKKNKAADIIGEPKYYEIDINPAPAQAAKAESPAPAQAANAGDSVKTVKSASALWAGRKKPLAGSGGVLAKARSDYARILAAFYAEGRYGASISIKINGQEAANIAYGTELPERSKIEISAEGGPQYKFAAAAISDKTHIAPPAAMLKARQEAAEKIGYQSGAPAKSGAVFAAENMAADKWRALGYAKAEIGERRIIADHAARTVSAEIAVAPGRQANFGALTIHNVSPEPRMKTAYVAWLTGLKEGEIYSPAALAKANARLDKLGVFRSATLTEAEKIAPNGLLPLSLTLQERPLHRFGAGGSYSTIDGVGLSSYWLHRNLFGHAEQLRFDAAVSNILGNRAKSSGNPSDYTYMLGGTFTRPGIFTPDTDYVASLKAEREVLDKYSSKGIYFSNGFNHMFNDRLSGYIYAQAARLRVKDNIWGRRDFTPLGFLGGLTYDSRDNKNDAAKGYYGELTAQPFYEAEKGNYIGKMTAEGRTYFSFDKNNRLIFAVRGKIGTIGGAPVSELPSNMLFFIGGGGSVRGYAYRSIGVYRTGGWHNKNGRTIGGRSMVEGSAELRAMLTESLGIVGFMDAGIVGKDPSPDFEQNARLGAGLGVRYKTGLGPLRFDVAVPLNRERGDSQYGLYIGLGQSF